MKKAIIIGASSGIGKALAKKLSNEGYVLGLIARREHLLKDLQKELPNKTYIKKLDITDTEIATNTFFDLINEMEDVDLVIINAGVGFSASYKSWGKDNFDWEKEKITIDTNVLAFSALAIASMHFFLKRKRGHIVGVSSIASFFGNPFSPAYSASKAYVSNYLQGLENFIFKEKKDIAITNIIPGFVDTAMAQGEKVFWKAKTSLAADQIFKAIEKKKKKAYITRRWLIVVFLLKILPNFLLKRIF